MTTWTRRGRWPGVRRGMVRPPATHITTFPGTMTLSGNEITPATRAAATEGDGRTDPSSVGIFRATTNLWINGGFEAGLTGVNPAGLAQNFTQDTTKGKFGAASLHFVRDGVTDGELGVVSAEAPVTEGTPYTLSTWLWLDAASGITTQVVVRIQETTGGSAQTGAFVVGLAGDTWGRAGVTRTLAAGVTGATGLVFHSGTTAQAGHAFWADGIQLEEGTYATPYVETAGTAATRDAARVQQPTALLSATTGGLLIHLTPAWANTARDDTPVLWQWQDDATNRLSLRYDAVNAQWVFERRNGGGTASVAVAATWAAETDHTIIASWDATTLFLSVDGAARTSQAGANIPTLAASTADIGSRGGSDSHIDAVIHWVIVGTLPISNATAAALHARGSNDPPLTALPDGWAYYWKARDETLLQAEETP